MVPASDAAASRWLLYTAAIPSGFLTKPRYTLPPRVWPWGCHFCSCNCPGIEAAWVSHAERLSHFSEKLQGHVARPEESWGDRQEGVFQEYKMWQLAWYKCACGSLAYLSRNTETWPSLGQHEKNKKNKTKQNKTTKNQKPNPFPPSRPQMKIKSLESHRVSKALELWSQITGVQVAPRSKFVISLRSIYFSFPVFGLRIAAPPPFFLIPSGTRCFPGPTS